MKSLSVIVALAIVVWGWLQWPHDEQPEHAKADRASPVASPAAPGLRLATPSPVELPPDPQGQLWLEGRAVDEAGEGVASAWIHIDSNPPTIVQTDDSGIFEVSGLLPRRYTVWARANARVCGPVGVHLGPDTDPLELVLRRAATVAVRVVELEGAQPPVADATVELVTARGVSAATNTEGVADLAGAQAGSHMLRVTAPGFAPSIVPLQVSPGQRRQSATVPLARGVRVVGSVVDASGHPLSGARVHPVAPGLEEQSKFLAVATTDSEGAFEFTALPATSFVFAASAPGRADATSELSTLTLDVVTNLPPLVLREGHTMTGTVRDSEGAAVADAAVQAKVVGDRIAPSRAWTATTDASGNFVIAGLPGAHLEVDARHEKSRSAKRIVDDPADGQSVELQLVASTRIAGTVVDASGEPVANAVVRAEPGGALRASGDGSPRVVTTSADGDGRFSADGLLPGHYLVRAAEAGGDPALVPARSVDSGRDDLVLTISGGGTIEGTVVDAEGSPVTDVSIRVDTGEVHRSRSAEGSFSAPVAHAGTHVVTVEAAGFEVLELDGVRVEEDEARDLGQLVLTAARDVAGVVVSADGEPVEGARVFAGHQIIANSRGGGRPTKTGGEVASTETKTDADGRFRLRGVGSQARVIAAEREGMGRARPVSLGAEAPAELTLTLVPTCALSGTVLRGEAAAPGAVVEATASDSTRLRVLAQADAQGRFHFSGLSTGAWSLRASVSTGVGRSLGVVRSVQACEDDRAEVQLPAEGEGSEVEVVIGGLPLGWAVVSLIEGEVDGANAAELETAMTNVVGAVFVDVALPEAPARFDDVPPGAYTACATVVAQPLGDPRAQRWVERHAEELLVRCATVQVRARSLSLAL